MASSHCLSLNYFLIITFKNYCHHFDDITLFYVLGIFTIFVGLNNNVDLQTKTEDISVSNNVNKSKTGKGHMIPDSLKAIFSVPDMKRESISDSMKLSSPRRPFSFLVKTLSFPLKIYIPCCLDPNVLDTNNILSEVEKLTLC